MLRILCDGVLLRELPGHPCSAWVEFESGTMREGQAKLKKLGWSIGRGVYEDKGVVHRPRLDWCPKCTKWRREARAFLSQRASGARSRTDDERLPQSRSKRRP